MSRASGWIEEPRVCKHPLRPTPTSADIGRRWWCEPCRTEFLVEGIDYGHDVMPGEPQTQLVWSSRRAAANSREPGDGR